MNNSLWRFARQGVTIVQQRSEMVLDGWTISVAGDHAAPRRACPYPFATPATPLRFTLAGCCPFSLAGPRKCLASMRISLSSRSSSVAFGLCRIWRPIYLCGRCRGLWGTLCFHFPPRHCSAVVRTPLCLSASASPSSTTAIAAKKVTAKAILAARLSIHLLWGSFIVTA